MNLRNFDENLADFEAAWHTQQRRRDGHAIQKHCQEPSLLFYGDMCSVGIQLKRLYSLVPRDRVHLVFFDDLKSQPRACYLHLLEFLGLPDDGRIEFPVVNRGASVRSHALQKVIRSLRRIRRTILPDQPTGITVPLRRWNRTAIQTHHIRGPLRAELIEYFAADVRLLQEVTGRRAWEPWGSQGTGALVCSPLAAAE